MAHSSCHRRWKTRFGVGAMLAIVVVLSGCLGPSQEPIRVYDGQWDSLRLNNAIAAFVIENGYGREVEPVVLGPEEMRTKLVDGDVDLNMEGWTTNWPESSAKHLEQGALENLGTTYEASQQLMIVPQWLADRHGIRSIEAMADHWRIFQDPQDPTKGLFYSCPLGTRCDEINRVLLRAFGLDAYYNVVNPPSMDALERILTRSARERRPVFGYHWTPTRLMWAHDWQILEMPPHSEDCWSQVIGAVQAADPDPIDHGCAYPKRPIDKIAHRSLVERAPQVVDMLDRMTVGLEPLNEIGAWVERSNVDSWDAAAKHYLRQYPDRWHDWLGNEAIERVNRALEAAKASNP